MGMDLEAKLKFLSYGSIAPAILSFIGSALAILTIHRTRKLGTQLTTYHRLVLGISIFDMIMSTAFALGPFPLPAETGRPGAHGTTGTCTLQAFMLQFGFASFGYSAMLMIYYVLVITFNMQETRISSRIEPFMHFIPVSFCFATAVVGIAWEVYNPTGGGWCWTADYPLGCSDDDAGIECERGEDIVHYYGWSFVTIPFLVWCITVVVAVLTVACTVVYRYRRSLRFVFGGSQRDNFRSKMTRQVITQCLLYGAAFINVMVWGALSTLMELFDIYLDYLNEYWWFMACSLFFVPIQGFFNFLIFIRPRYLKNRTDYGRFASLREAIWNPVATGPASSGLRSGSSNAKSQGNSTSEISYPGERDVSSKSLRTEAILEPMDGVPAEGESSPGIDDIRIEEGVPSKDGETRKEQAPKR